jgi:glycine cleavage system transcriptional repressor
MSILRGHFAMMLVVAAPDALEQGALEAALAGPAAEFELVVAVRAIDDDVPRSPEGDAWTVSVYGADRPGIVHRVASLLADNGVNIVDLTTRVIGDADRPVYAMILEVTLPAAAEAANLQSRLASLAHDLGVECSLHPSEADIL